MRETFALTDHICGTCFGRILYRDPRPMLPASHQAYRCAGCGAEHQGPNPSSLCLCGERFGPTTDGRMTVCQMANDVVLTIAKTRAVLDRM